MNDWYIYEFLFRGLHPTETQPTGWHVVLRNVSTREERTLNVEQAKAEGFDLSSVLREINSEALAAADASSKSVEELRTQLSEAEARPAEPAEAPVSTAPLGFANLSPASPGAATPRKKFLGIF